jgi:hypothetical protein
MLCAELVNLSDPSAPCIENALVGFKQHRTGFDYRLSSSVAAAERVKGEARVPYSVLDTKIYVTPPLSGRDDGDRELQEESPPRFRGCL